MILRSLRWTNDSRCLILDAAVPIITLPAAALPRRTGGGAQPKAQPMLMKSKTGTMLIAVMLLLTPFVILVWLTAQEYHRQWEFTAKERTGLHYHNALFDLLTARQYYRAEQFLAIADRKQNAVRLTETGQIFAGRIKAVEAQKFAAVELGLAGQWESVQQGLSLSLKDDSGLSPRALYERNRQAAVALNNFMKDVALTANLALDPEPESHAMISIIADLVPKAMDDLGYARGRIAGVLAVGPMTPEAGYAFAGYESKFNAFEDDYSYALDILRQHDSQSIFAGIDRETGALDKMRSTLNLFHDLMNSRVDAGHQAFFAGLTDAIAALRQSYEKFSAHLDRHLHERQDGIRRRLAGFGLTLAAILGMSVAFLIFAFRNMARKEELNNSRQIKAILDTVLDGLVTIDARGCMQSFNPAATRIFGYQSDEVIGRNVKMLMPEPYHSGHDGYLKNYLEGGQAKIIGSGREVAAQRKDGSIFPMELGVNEMNVDGRRMFVGTIRDITGRKESEQAIQQHLAALKRSNQELDDFAYIASHDLKEPLRGLSNNALFLKEDFADQMSGDAAKRLNRMTYLCERMERLVDDLLYFSRLGRQDLAVQRTDLNTVIQDITALMETALQDGHAAIRIPESLPVIVCDLPRVTEVFRNLISNAVKYNDKPEKWIEIGCTDLAKFDPQAASRRVFYVKDNGIGIAEEFHEEVFRIFKRLNEEDETVKGTGVGLTFVRKIVERHGGRIWIESAPGRGSTFYFTLNESKEDAPCSTNFH